MGYLSCQERSCGLRSANSHASQDSSAKEPPVALDGDLDHCPGDDQAATDSHAPLPPKDICHVRCWQERDERADRGGTDEEAHYIRIEASDDHGSNWRGNIYQHQLELALASWNNLHSGSTSRPLIRLPL